MSFIAPTVIALSGLTLPMLMKPVMSSRPMWDSRQCASAVPMPPVLATGTLFVELPPFRSYWVTASVPGQYGSAPPASTSVVVQGVDAPNPSTCPISWMIVSTRSLVVSRSERSASSNCITPTSARPPVERTTQGPAWPRMPPDPSIAVTSAKITTSSIVSSTAG